MAKKKQAKASRKTHVIRVPVRYTREYVLAILEQAEKLAKVVNKE